MKQHEIDQLEEWITKFTTRKYKNSPVYLMAAPELIRRLRGLVVEAKEANKSPSRKKKS